MFSCYFQTMQLLEGLQLNYASCCLLTRGITILLSRSLCLHLEKTRTQKASFAKRACRTDLSIQEMEENPWCPH